MPLEPPPPPEFAPFYADYVAALGAADALAVLADQRGELDRLAAVVTPERETFRYAPGKWSVREVFGHLVDAERVFGYRAFCISRGDRTPLPGFDENAYLARSDYHRLELAAVLRELKLVREANLAVLERVEPALWAQVGNANGADVSLRAIAYIIAGHMRHHLDVLAERYRVALPA